MNQYFDRLDLTSGGVSFSLDGSGLAADPAQADRVALCILDQ